MPYTQADKRCHRCGLLRAEHYELDRANDRFRQEFCPGATYMDQEEFEAREKIKRALEEEG
jgi:hypothetical protein